MNKKHTVSSIWRVLLAIVAILMTSGISPLAVAADYTLGSTNGTWSGATSEGDSPTCIRYLNVNSPTYGNVVAYGDNNNYFGHCPSSWTSQSAFGFKGVGEDTFTPGEDFVLGEFTHYNRPIYIEGNNTLETVDLAISLNFTDPVISTELNYTMRLDETDNSGTCTYPGSTVCPDKVDFADTVADETFEIGGVFYTLQIVGFIPGTLSSYDPSDTPINQFITEENQENHAVLIGRIIVAAPGLSIDKVADVSEIGIGGYVNYTITVKNTGDVTLTDVTVTDAKLLIDENVGSLAVNESKVVTGTYGPVTESDLYVIHNVAYAVSNETESVNDDADVTVVTDPGLSIDKVADVSEIGIGGYVNYTITVKNTGDVTLTDVTVTDAKLLIDENVGSLAVNESKVVTGTYGPVTESDLYVIHNVAYAVSNETESVNDDADVTVVTDPGLSIDKVADVSEIGIGGYVNYTITVKNTGDVTLTDVTVTDAKLLIDENVGSLAVNESKVVTGTYGPVTESDLYVIHNVAYAVSNETESVNDDADVTVVTDPGLSIDKVADVSEIGIGGYVNYTITVKNTGDVTLTDVTVTDAKLLIDENVGSLAVNESKVVTGTYGPVTESDLYVIHNVAYAVSNETESVNDDADVTVVTDPGLSIDKVADVSEIGIGGYVNYTITVKNTGDVTLTDVTVTDAKLLIDENVGSLAVNESKVVTGTYGPVTESDLYVIHNVAYAVSNETESVNDDADVTVVTDPGLSIDKVADVSEIGIGGYVNYTITVKNTGDVTLTDVTVTDAKLLIDENVGSLAVNESKVVTGTYGPVTESDLYVIHNVAYAVSNETESVNDDADVTVVTDPGLSIDKVADVSEIGIGGYVNYTITVKNTGDVTLTDVTVTDAKLLIDENVGSLAVNESKVVTGTYGPVTESDLYVIHNVAYAVSNETESVNDDADVTINTNPGLTIDKVADVSVVAIGGTINYTITVTNNGDITLTNVMVTDAKLGINQNVGNLAPQESKVVTGSYGPVAEDDLPSVYNVAYATSDQTQSVQDDVTVELATEPGLAIDKTGPSTVVAGDYIEYTITVSNIGNVTLHNVVVTDTKLGLVATLPELAVGASQVITGTYGPVSEADQPGPVHNVATADSDETGPVSDDHDVEIEQPFEPRAALEIVKTGDAVVNIGEMIDYEITVTNIGNVDLNNVVVTDAKLGLNQTIALLAVGDSETINASYGPVTEADGDQVVNTAVADSDETDPEEDDWTTVVVSTPGLAITKTGPATAEVGDTIDYEITVMNTGDVTLHNVVVTDARLGYTETLAELAPGASVVLTVSYGPVGEADLPGPIINTAVAEADEAGPVEDSWSVDLEVPYYEEPEDCVRADVSVVIYGGWNDIAVRAWVGGTEQDMLYTETNADGEAQVMWTLYPPESGSWSVQVAPELPSGLDATRWEYRLVRVESPSEDWSTENPSSATVTVRRCNQYVFYYQLYDKGTTEEIVTPPVLPQTGNIDMVTSANNGLVLWLKVGFLGLLGMVGLISSRNKKETEK